MRERLESFVSGGFSLQASSARAALGLAAALVLTGGIGGPERPRGGDARLVEGAYSRLMDEVQDEADVHLGFGRLTVVDRSSDPGSERERIALRIPGGEVTRRAAVAVSWGGAQGRSETFDLSEDAMETGTRAFRIPDGMTCLVVGARPGARAREMAGGSEGMEGVAVSGLHRWAIWREVGHCMGGASDVVADTFAALMSRRSPDGRGVAEAMALNPPEGSDPDVARIRARALAIAADPSGNGLANPDAMDWGRVAEMATRIASVVSRAAPAPPAPVASAPETDEDEDEPDQAPAPR